jgi:hypothetical protein
MVGSSNAVQQFSANLRIACIQSFRRVRVNIFREELILSQKENPQLSGFMIRRKGQFAGTERTRSLWCRSAKESEKNIAKRGLNPVVPRRASQKRADKVLSLSEAPVV